MKTFDRVAMTTEGSAGVRTVQTTRNGTAYLQVGTADSKGPTMSSPGFFQGPSGDWNWLWFQRGR